jgi:hypothetical protein
MPDWPAPFATRDEREIEAMMLDKRLIPLRDQISRVLDGVTGLHVGATTTEAGALLAPDGPLWPALQALGRRAADDGGRYSLPMERRYTEAKRALKAWGVTGPLADACLAAAEVTP